MEDLIELIEILNNDHLQAYLVGGVLRDYLLKRELVDIDLVISQQVEKVARDFAERLGASLVVLDELRQTYRVVAEDFIYDFTPLQGESIEQDLKRRDFTINALALPLERELILTLIAGAEIEEHLIIDPGGAVDDLENGCLEAVSERALLDDPLRIFRALRFKAELGFEISADTERLLKEVALEEFEGVAGERIREELIKILACSKAAQHLNYLEEELGLLSFLIPEIEDLKVRGQCKYHCEDIWTHSLYAIEKLEQLLELEFWSREIAEERIALLKWALLFHDLGKLDTEQIRKGRIVFYNHHRVGAKKIKGVLGELAFSKRQLAYMQSLIRYHMRPLALFNAENLTDRGKYRFFRAGGEFVADICLLAGADMLSTRELNPEVHRNSPSIDEGLKFLEHLVRENQKMAKKTKEPLVDGQQVMELLDLEEGPQVGRVLEQVHRAQALGEVSTEQEAIEYLGTDKEELR